MDGASLTGVDWRDFESHCGTVLRENGYGVIGGLCFRNDERKFQIDIVATSIRHALCIDCKAWRSGGGGGRSIKAAEAQLERTTELRSFLSEEGPDSLGELALFPVVVTMMREGISIHEGIPIIPFELFNSFLVNFDSYEDELARV